MTHLKLLSAGFVAVAMLAAPAMAREGHTSRHHAEAANPGAAPAPIDVAGRLCYPAPRVGAFATEPWTGGNVPCEPESGAY
jgi:hypothetical protein